MEGERRFEMIDSKFALPVDLLEGIMMKRELPYPVAETREDVVSSP